MIKSVSSLLFYVTNARKTVAFYKTLGFIVVKDAPGHGIVRMNWFTMHFHDKKLEKNPEFIKEAAAEPKGSGLYIYVSVEKIDAYYKSLLKKKIKPRTEPRDWPWGNREFVVRDPDGYKLVFFEEIRK